MISKFQDAMRVCGITPPHQIIADGEFHRFSTNGKTGDDAGWYVYYDGLIPAGAFGDWRNGLKETWRMDIGRKLTSAEQSAYQGQLETMRLAREAEEALRYAEASKTAARLLEVAFSASNNHPYLQRKCVGSTETLGTIHVEDAIDIIGYPPQAKGEALTGELLIAPIYINGKISSVEMIDEMGRKSALLGGKKKGGYWPVQQPPDGNGAGQIILIGEGVATVLSAHEATGYDAVAALTSSNLAAVAKAMHQRYPAITLVILADLLKDTGECDPKATEAARATGGNLAVPNFGYDRPSTATDFNDMAILHGLKSVEASIQAAIQNLDVTSVTNVQPSNDADFSVTADTNIGVTDVTEDELLSIPEGNRPCFKVLDDWTQILEYSNKLKPGVWHFGIKAGKDAEPPILTQQWICSPLHVDAVTFDGQENNFGRLLRFLNTNKKWREWAMPMELLRGSGDDMRGELLSMGVEIDPSLKVLLANYLQSQHPKKRMHCALQVGWCKGSFVLPDVVIGPNALSVIFQSGNRGHDEHTRAGTLEGWQTDIAAKATGNPVLMAALSAAFAGPLLERCNAEGGGFHLVGDSSTGKTTAIEAACSVWGGPTFKRSWRATANGMEGAAALFNDCLLALDEISECDSKEIGAIVYALGNGTGKQRANRSGAARSILRWRCSVLSSGERTIATAMAEGGYRAKAGQSMRLLDIPVARKFGAWDNLHDVAGSAAFSDALKRAAVKHHGHVGRAFLVKLTHDNRDFCILLEQIKELPEFFLTGSEGQDKRAAARFALLALSGELATEYGLTGWSPGSATAAAAECFKVWRSARAPGNNEKHQILEKVSGFIERHGDGRFSWMADTAITIKDRAGWWRDDASGRVYLFTATGLRDALIGFDFNRALDILQESGALQPPDSSGERAKSQRIGGRPVRVYTIFPEKLGGIT